jgi:hypothetical protein
MFLLTILLKSTLFLSFSRPLDLFLLKPSIDFRPFIRPRLIFAFNVISAILALNVRDLCKLEIYMAEIIFLRDLLALLFF